MRHHVFEMEMPFSAARIWALFQRYDLDGPAAAEPLTYAQLAEEFDMAIIAGEGYATEACRVLFDGADKGHQYKLAVLHDSDPYGYNIARTLQAETARMPGYSVKVIDIGLRLAPGRHTNRRPTICGCSVFTNTATRHNGMPQATSRSDNWAKTSCGCTADRAPSVSQSAIALIFGSRIGRERSHGIALKPVRAPPSTIRRAEAA